MTVTGYELRRHRPSVLAACAMLLPLPLVHRMAEGHWGFWSGDWKEGGALFVQFFLAPVLAAALALSGWAGERAHGTLGWLYSRPVPAGTILAARFVAILAAVGAFIAIAFAVLLRDPRTLVALPEGMEPLKFLGLVPVGFTHWMALIGLAATGGMLASALASTPGSAARGFLLGTVAAALVLVFSWSYMLLKAVRWSDEALARVLALQLVAWALAAGLGVWAAVRVAPLDRSRYLRAAMAVVVPALLGALLVAIVAVHPVHFGTQFNLGARDLGEGVELHLVRSTTMRPRVAISRVVDDTGSVVTVPHATHLAVQDVFPNRARGIALIKHIRYDSLDDGWAVVTRSGDFLEVTFPGHVLWPIGLSPLGWSPEGARFAWSSRRGSDLVVLTEDLATRRFILPVEGDWRAAWLDEERLIVGPEPERLWEDAWGPIPLATRSSFIVDVTRPADVQPVDARVGERQLMFPALMASNFRRPWTRTAPSLQGRAIGIGLGSSGLELLTLDTADGALMPVAGLEIDIPLRCAGFGNTAAGDLVWLSPRDSSERTVQVNVLWPTSGSTGKSCTFERQSGMELLRWLGSSGDWVVWEEGSLEWLYPRPEDFTLSAAMSPAPRLLACDLNTGDARFLEKGVLMGLVSVGSEGLLTHQGTIAFEDLEHFPSG